METFKWLVLTCCDSRLVNWLKKLTVVAVVSDVLAAKFFDMYNVLLKSIEELHDTQVLGGPFFHGTILGYI